jgi:hypothetical protein
MQRLAAASVVNPALRRMGRGCFGASSLTYLFVLIAVASVSTRVSEGRSVFVSPSGTHQPPYATWTDAATNLDAAVAVAEDGDTVLMTNGTYLLYAEVFVAKGITIQGVRGAEATIIRGGYPISTNRCFHLSHANAILRGVTVTNGWAPGTDFSLYDPSPKGGGILIDGSGGLVQNCTVAGNSAGSGGGVFCESGLVRDCVIVRNKAQIGGGVFLGDTDTVRSAPAGETPLGSPTEPKVQGCSIAGNSAWIAAGAVCSFRGTIERCSFAGNLAVSDNASPIEAVAGGVLLYQGGAMENSLIASNTAHYGAGLMCWDGGNVRTSTVVTNTASAVCGGVFCLRGGQLENVISFLNSSPNAPNWWNEDVDSNFTHSCTFPLPPGEGNITNAPQFVAALAGDFHLLASSPCIDAGTAAPTATNDLDGVPRPLDGDNDKTAQSDIGAYEFVHPSADTDVDEMPDKWELSHTLDPLTDDAQGDPDSDTMRNLGEYISDTDPHDGDSVLALLRIDRQFGGIRLDWKGGREAWQILECRENLASTTGQWTAIFALPPPTAFTNAVIDMGATNPVLFYRIRAER